MHNEADRMKFVIEMLTYFGYKESAKEVVNAQSQEWERMFEETGLSHDENLAKKYRERFYTQKMYGPFTVYGEFCKFIINHPRIREEHYEERNAYLERHECDVCEGSGVLMVPVTSTKTGEIHNKAFKCTCDFGRIKFGGLPEASSEMMRWRSDENKRENDRARKYLQSVGIDPDQKFTFREMLNRLKKIELKSQKPVLNNHADLLVHAGGDGEQWDF